MKQPNQLDSKSSGGAGDIEIVIEPRSGWHLVDIGEVLRYRDLLYFMVLRDIKIIYKQTVLGLGWAVLRPLLAMLIFTVVFGRLARLPSDGLPYPLFAYSALVPWTYLSTTILASTESLIKEREMITKVYFPRVFVPLAPALAKLIDFAIALLLIGVLMAWYGLMPSWQMLWAPLPLAIMVAFGVGMGTWLSALAVQYRDVKYVGQFLVQVMMYAAPVVWPVSLVPERWRAVYAIYPAAGIVEGFRASLIGYSAMPWKLLSISAASTLVILISGLLFFRRVERRFADVA